MNLFDGFVRLHLFKIFSSQWMWIKCIVSLIFENLRFFFKSLDAPHTTYAQLSDGHAVI